MIERLPSALAGSGEPGLPELRQTLDEALGGSFAASALLQEERLKSRVYRLTFAVPQGVLSVIVKRLSPAQAVRDELVATRWLPAVGLGGNGPGLLGIAGVRSGECVWHVYEDLGDTAIAARRADAGCAAVPAAARLIAQLHSRFASHPLLAECRQHAEHLDISCFASNVHDAIRSLQAMRPADRALSAEEEALRDRLVARLVPLRDDVPRRAHALAAWGGPETLLHGDLWTSNALAMPAADGYRVRLIDWDHAGVGPASYDLSTFLLRFPVAQRRRVLDLYAASIEGDGWRLPGRPELNLLFETAELARYANRAIWPALAITREGAAWGATELAEVDSWFEALEPVLPEEPASGVRAVARP